MLTGKGKGPIGKMRELTDAFKKAQEVQEGAKKLQEELDKLEVGGSAGDGLVKVFLSGNQEPRRVEISPDLLKKEADEVAELVTAAMKEAYKQSTSTMRERMESLTNGLDIPKL
ncbi:MAG: YbaB/EbfC family nucleoid-associated protein [Trichodesmium sp. MAG_R04]|nr:YbaB/EbfC family nucleoid-associated protein [Trichodesmium sp. MAG_R04]